MNEHCHNLDAFLAEDLPADDAALFVAHLQRCEACSEAIETQHWLDGMLRSDMRTELEPVPERLSMALQTATVEHGVATRRWAAIGFATAAALLVAVGWIALDRRAEHGQENADVAQTAVEAKSTPRVRAKFVASENTIAVPVASRHPDVTIVRLYPAFRPQLQSRTATLEPEAVTTNN
ncbi:MAG TPA: hypothetical protein VHU84_19280 [Lacipirellulaceae bacterium]|jgi:anti-sigma factor RsiW|nr:hypothetical protein [Lacipirellulaceae bacterium]